MAATFQGLDENQRKAVQHTTGPLLVLAGAGSGKTRVLSHRIARLVKEKLCSPEQILAVTFTNKAAREMRERVSVLTSAKSSRAMTIATFHSFGARILREHGQIIGLKRNFTILDDNDRISTVKSIMRSHSTARNQDTLDDFMTQISLAKNASVTPDTFGALNPEKRKLQRVYKTYSAQLMKRQAVDFDDLLLLPLQLFQKHHEILDIYRKRYRFISIDEFQDTNTVQMKLARLLAAPKNNLFAVGDDDQGIYSWRGADLDNILTFPALFDGCTTVILNRNYRSTSEIVEGAYGVIGHNQKRTVKKVSSARGSGDPIITFKADDEKEEIEWIITTISAHTAQTRLTYKDHAILLRTNALMARFEEELRIRRIPYHVQGALSFFERKEVKDVIAYLRFFANTHDELSLARILKVPDKGITKSTVERLEDLAGLRKISLWEAFEHSEDAQQIQDGQKEKIHTFKTFCRSHMHAFSQGDLSQTLRNLLDECGYISLLRQAYKNDKSLDMRLENVAEIIHGLEIFEKKNKSRKPCLYQYLQECALLANDDPDDEAATNGVVIMTLHKAKGLEFPVVFMPVLDDAVIPSPRSAAEGRIEEERRLFYVGMTRAQKKLILTYPKSKIYYKKTVAVKPCRFLHEIPEEYLDGEFGKKQDQENDAFTADFFARMKKRFAGADN